MVSERPKWAVRCWWVQPKTVQGCLWFNWSESISISIYFHIFHPFLSAPIDLHLFPSVFIYFPFVYIHFHPFPSTSIYVPSMYIYTSFYFHLYISIYVPSMSIYFLLFPSMSHLCPIYFLLFPIYFHLCPSMYIYFLLFPSIYFHLCSSMSHLLPSISIYFRLCPSISYFPAQWPKVGHWLSHASRDRVSKRCLRSMEIPTPFFVVSKFKWIQMVEFRDVPIGIGGCFFPHWVSFVVVCHTLMFSICIVSIAFFALGSVGASHADPTNRETTRQKHYGKRDTMKKWKRGGRSEERDIRKRQTLRWEPSEEKELTSLELRSVPSCWAQR